MHYFPDRQSSNNHDNIIAIGVVVHSSRKGTQFSITIQTWLCRLTMRSSWVLILSTASSKAWVTLQLSSLSSSLSCICCCKLKYKVAMKCACHSCWFHIFCCFFIVYNNKLRQQNWNRNSMFRVILGYFWVTLDYTVERDPSHASWTLTDQTTWQTGAYFYIGNQ